MSLGSICCLSPFVSLPMPIHGRAERQITSHKLGNPHFFTLKYTGLVCLVELSYTQPNAGWLWQRKRHIWWTERDPVSQQVHVNVNMYISQVMLRVIIGNCRFKEWGRKWVCCFGLSLQVPVEERKEPEETATETEGLIHIVISSVSLSWRYTSWQEEFGCIHISHYIIRLCRRQLGDWYSLPTLHCDCSSCFSALIITL